VIVVKMGVTGGRKLPLSLRWRESQTLVAAQGSRRSSSDSWMEGGRGVSLFCTFSIYDTEI
jgi:hypothetical protein